MMKTSDHNIFIGVEVGKSLSEGSHMVIGVPGNSVGERQNMNATQNLQKHCTFEAAKDSLDQDYDLINLEVNNTDNEGPQTETPLNLIKKSRMKPLLPLHQIFKHPKKVRNLNTIQWVKI
ncbi:hypothetical protein O181_009862 [Austropuccinia psidii MF-1]|uniref:Uncharacterized protein n=1 Tax=Austropuccinia psidii MF-1 TaxID=1389203 RepID=A0A9Q3BSL9_9BASI|nr:hypothetical protein [Austropuccinia psidii MF-1]